MVEPSASDRAVLAAVAAHRRKPASTVQVPMHIGDAFTDIRTEPLAPHRISDPATVKPFTTLESLTAAVVDLATRDKLDPRDDRADADAIVATTRAHQILGLDSEVAARIEVITSAALRQDEDSSIFEVVNVERIVDQAEEYEEWLDERAERGDVAGYLRSPRQVADELESAVRAAFRVSDPSNDKTILDTLREAAHVALTALRRLDPDPEAAAQALDRRSVIAVVHDTLTQHLYGLQAMAGEPVAVDTFGEPRWCLASDIDPDLEEQLVVLEHEIRVLETNYPYLTGRPAPDLQAPDAEHHDSDAVYESEPPW